MLSDERQTKLNPILERLGVITGVESVTQDDFDSTAVNIFVMLKVAQQWASLRGGSVPLQFTSTIRKIKTEIRKVCNGNFNFLHWPSMTYIWNPNSGSKERDGYDCTHIKIEVFV
jgi:hypothetical protein